MRREHPVIKATLAFALAASMVWGGVPAAALAQMAGEAPDASIEAVSPAGADEPGEALEPDGGAVEEDGQAATGDAPELTVGDAPELAAPGGDGELRGPDPEIEEEIEEGPEAGAAASEDAVVEELAACGDGSAPLEADALEPEPDGDPAVEPDGLGAQAAKRASISGARVAKVAAQPFTGKAVRPSPKVTFGGATLRKGVDYVLSYRNNKRPGRATIEVRGKGAYAGTKRVGFRIVAPSVTYRVHVQTYGDQSARGDGAVAGTSGEAKRLEAIWVSLGKGFPVAGGIRYRTHVQSYGWMPWKGNGQKSGTSGEGKRLEAIEVELTGGMARKYDVWYRVHAQHFGWMGWAKNGASAGTQGFAYRLEAIQVVLSPKGTSAPSKNLGNCKQSNSHCFLRYTSKTYPSLASVGIGYGDVVNAKVDGVLADLSRWCALKGTDFNAGLSKYNRAKWILRYVGTHYRYGDGSYAVESMIDNGYGTCFAFSDLVYCLVRKVGLTDSWLSEPGRPSDHWSTALGTYLVYGTQHRTVVSRFGGRYYDLDGNLAIYGTYDPAPISDSYAKYLLGKQDSYTSFE